MTPRGKGGSGATQHIWRALLLRCPLCSNRAILAHWLRMKPVCPGCGLKTDRGEPDYFIGGYTLNFVTAELVAVSVLGLTVLARWPVVPWRGLMWGGALLMVLMPLLFYPFSRTLWLAIDLTFRPAEEKDFTARPEAPSTLPSDAG
jgi:uncharacterized protein (DUF983 family)